MPFQLPVGNPVFLLFGLVFSWSVLFLLSWRCTDMTASFAYGVNSQLKWLQTDFVKSFGQPFKRLWARSAFTCISTSGYKDALSTHLTFKWFTVWVVSCTYANCSTRYKLIGSPESKDGVFWEIFSCAFSLLRIFLCEGPGSLLPIISYWILKKKKMSWKSCLYSPIRNYGQKTARAFTKEDTQ